MPHLLGDGIFPHVAPASVELQALGGHPVLEVRRPGGKTGNIREHQQPGLFVRSDKLVNTKRTFSPVFGHGGRGGVQASLGVQLKAVIYEGSAHADLRLQLCQFVLHSLRRKGALIGVLSRFDRNRLKLQSNST